MVPSLSPPREIEADTTDMSLLILSSATCTLTLLLIACLALIISFFNLFGLSNNSMTFLSLSALSLNSG